MCSVVYAFALLDSKTLQMGAILMFFVSHYSSFFICVQCRIRVECA